MRKGILSSFVVLFVVAILIGGCSKPEEKKAEAPPVEKQAVEEKAPVVKQEMVEKDEPTAESATMTDKVAGAANEIDTSVDLALEQFKKDIKGGDEFLKSAKGVLVFPSVFKAGVGVGGEYGEGALQPCASAD
jgi:hypothetical protein